MPASSQSSSRGAAGPNGATSPLLVAVVAGTRTRIRVLEKLLTQPGIALVGSAQDPSQAEHLVLDAKPQAVLLDLDLWSGGLESIERIMAGRATPIVVIGPAAEHPEAAIAAGAVDVVGSLDVAPGTPEYAHIVMRHLTIASRVRVITHPRARLRKRGSKVDGEPASRTTHPSSEQPERQPTADVAVTDATSPGERRRAPAPSRQAVAARPHQPGRGPRVVAIGASTGGPPALATILAELPAELPAAVLIVQHMAEGFVEGLARWLDGVCALPVVVAVEGERVRAGQVYLAPANQNMVVRPGFRIGLEEPPPGQYHVPGVDVTFRSVAQLSGPNAVGALLTGMGRDGAAGLRAMREAGAFTVGQDESTSVVWGMPAAAQELDAVDLELPLTGVAAALIEATCPAESTGRVPADAVTSSSTGPNSGSAR